MNFKDELGIFHQGFRNGIMLCLIMLATLLRQHEVQMELLRGRLVCVMNCAANTTLCSFLRSSAEQSLFQAVMHWDRMVPMDSILLVLIV